MYVCIPPFADTSRRELFPSVLLIHINRENFLAATDDDDDDEKGMKPYMLFLSFSFLNLTKRVPKPKGDNLKRNCLNYLSRYSVCVCKMKKIWEVTMFLFFFSFLFLDFVFYT